MSSPKLVRIESVSITEVRLIFDIDVSAESVVADNFSILSTFGGDSGLTVRSAFYQNSQDRTTIIIKTEDQIPYALYKMVWVNLRSDSDNQKVIEDGINNSAIFHGFFEENYILLNMFDRLPPLYQKRKVATPVATRQENTNIYKLYQIMSYWFFNLDREVGKTANDNYISIEVNDEQKVRGANDKDILNKEGAYEITRVSRYPFSAERERYDSVNITFDEDVQLVTQSTIGTLDSSGTIPVVVDGENSISNGTYTITTDFGPIIKVLYVKNLTTNIEYGIDSYFLTNNFYDQNNAFIDFRLEQNQFRLNALIQSASAAPPLASDELLVVYVIRETDRQIIPEQTVVSAVLTVPEDVDGDGTFVGEDDIVEEINEVNSSSLFLSNSNIQNSTNSGIAIPGDTSLTFYILLDDGSQYFAGDLIPASISADDLVRVNALNDTFAEEVTWDTGGTSDLLAGQYRVNYQRLAQLRSGTEIVVATPLIDPVFAQYNYKVTYRRGVDYEILTEQTVLGNLDQIGSITRIDSELSKIKEGQTVLVEYAYESAFIRDIDYTLASNVYVCNERMDNRASINERGEFIIRPLSTPIQEIIEVRNETTQEKYTPIFYNEGEIIIRGNSLPRLVRVNRERVNFSEVRDELIPTNVTRISLDHNLILGESGRALGGRIFDATGEVELDPNEIRAAYLSNFDSVPETTDRGYGEYYIESYDDGYEGAFALRGGFARCVAGNSMCFVGKIDSSVQFAPTICQNETGSTCALTADRAVPDDFATDVTGSDRDSLIGQWSPNFNDSPDLCSDANNIDRNLYPRKDRFNDGPKGLCNSEACCRYTPVFLYEVPFIDGDTEFYIPEQTVIESDTLTEYVDNQDGNFNFFTDFGQITKVFEVYNETQDVFYMVDGDSNEFKYRIKNRDYDSNAIADSGLAENEFRLEPSKISPEFWVDRGDVIRVKYSYRDVNSEKIPREQPGAYSIDYINGVVYILQASSPLESNTTVSYKHGRIKTRNPHILNVDKIYKLKKSEAIIGDVEPTEILDIGFIGDDYIDLTETCIYDSGHCTNYPYPRTAKNLQYQSILTKLGCVNDVGIGTYQACTKWDGLIQSSDELFQITVDSSPQNDPSTREQVSDSNTDANKDPDFIYRISGESRLRGICVEQSCRNYRASGLKDAFGGTVTSDDNVVQGLYYPNCRNGLCPNYSPFTLSDDEDLYVDYTYIADEVLLTYTWGDNSIDFSINPTVLKRTGPTTPGEEYYVSYRYGARREALFNNFGSLLNINLLNDSARNWTRDSYRKALLGVIQAYINGPTLPSIKKLVNIFTGIDPIITESGFSNWVLGENLLYELPHQFEGKEEYSDSKCATGDNRFNPFSQGLVVKDLDTLKFRTNPNLRIGEGTLQFLVTPFWKGLDNSKPKIVSSRISTSVLTTVDDFSENSSSTNILVSSSGASGSSDGTIVLDT